MTRYISLVQSLPLFLYTMSYKTVKQQTYSIKMPCYLPLKNKFHRLLFELEMLLRDIELSPIIHACNKMKKMVPITTDVVSSNHAQSEVFSIM
jgi:hypothetical protein